LVIMHSGEQRYSRGVAGYSGTPLPRKLGIGPGDTVLASHAPTGLDLTGLLVPWPVGARLVRRHRGSDLVSVVLLFAESRADLDTRLPVALGQIPRDGAVWVVWPKKSSERWRSGERTVTEDVVRAAALALGVVDVKVCAVDETWSGLKLVYRLEDR
jgi:hypothetical protein